MKKNITILYLASFLVILFIYNSFFNKEFHSFFINAFSVNPVIFSIFFSSFVAIVSLLAMFKSNTKQKTILVINFTINIIFAIITLMITIIALPFS